MNLWCYIIVSSMFSMFSHIEASYAPSTKHQWFIDETSMIHRWNIDEPSMKRRWITEEEIATFTCSTAEFKNINLRNLQISLIPIKLSKTVELKSKRAIIRTLSKNKLTDVFQNDFHAYRGTLWAICSQTNYQVSTASSRIFLQKVHRNFFRTSYKKVLAGLLKWISACPYYQRG